MHLHIAHLYPQTMSTYGDIGNVTCLIQRCAWRSIEVTVHSVEIGEPIPADIDLYFFGGGQDVAQEQVAVDLQGEKGNRLLVDTAAGIPLLAICGGYQLLGKSYKPAEGKAIPGIGLFPATTVADSKRMIGNLVLKTDKHLSLPSNHETLVGFENHSGKTTVVDTDQAHPLGTVLAGFGNNGEDKTEGCCVYHAIGCYLHGSLLPKNPHLADWLLEKALNRRYPNTTLEALDDTLEWAAHDTIVGRYT